MTPPEMQIERRFDRENNYVVTKVFGPLDLDAALRGSTELVNHPDFAAGMNSVWDLLDATVDHLSTPDFQRGQTIPRLDKDNRGAAKVIFVIANKLQYGVARMYLVHAGLEHLDYRIVSSMPEALKELGLPG